MTFLDQVFTYIFELYKTFDTHFTSVYLKPRLSVAAKFNVYLCSYLQLLNNAPLYTSDHPTFILWRKHRRISKTNTSLTLKEQTTGFLRHESSSASTNWTEFPGQPEITKKNFHISFGSCVICGLHCILLLYLCVLESWFNCLLLNRRKPLRLKRAEIRIKLQFQLECHLAWKKGARTELIKWIR